MGDCARRSNIMDGSNTSRKDFVVLTLFAVKYGLHNAKKLAEDKNIEWDKEKALNVVRNLLGEDEYKVHRYIWDEERMAAFDKKMDARIAPLAAELRRQHQESLNKSPDIAGVPKKRKGHKGLERQAGKSD